MYARLLHGLGMQGTGLPYKDGAEVICMMTFVFEVTSLISSNNKYSFEIQQNINFKYCVILLVNF